MTDLSVSELVKEATSRAGPLSGEVPFTANLELLVGSCRRTGALNATGKTVLRKAAVRHLRNLMAVQAHVGADPGVAGRPLATPLVVTGLPRTGTTLLHNLLALDPALRVLRLWEALRPVAPGPGGPTAAELQAQAGRWLDAFYRMVPEFRTIHPTTPTGPEECDALLQNTFASQHFDDMFDAEAYSAWLATSPLAAEYEHYALQLRVLSPPSGAAPTWALKSPSHLGHLDALRAALPGCTVVLCHRHPREAVASYASLMLAVRRPNRDATSPAAVGRQALARAATAVHRALSVRDEAQGGAFVDVAYPELVRDPVRTLRGVYEQAGRRLEADVEARLRRWVDDNPQHKHGRHRYDLARFGLLAEDVDAAFAPYLDRYGPALSPAGGEER